MTSGAFNTWEPVDVRRLIEDYPLAWVCAAGGPTSLLPLVGVFDASDRLIELIGHFGRSNPLHAALKADPRATILFTGPQGYVSPSQAGRRNWGPTWNYAQARIEAEISVEPDFTPDAVDRLVEHVERDFPEPWRADELGERYDLLISMIIGFRADVRRLDATFKLGQTEDAPTLENILSNLTDETLVSWMRRFNAGGGSPKEGAGD